MMSVFILYVWDENTDGINPWLFVWTTRVGDEVVTVVPIVTIQTRDISTLNSPSLTDVEDINSVIKTVATDRHVTMVFLHDAAKEEVVNEEEEDDEEAEKVTMESSIIFPRLNVCSKNLDIVSDGWRK